jgi:hypothetical protein
MAEQCQAYAHRYVGKGKDRILYEGPCVLPERGHDGDHLPYSLATIQRDNQAFNAGLDEALAVVAYHLGSKGPETMDLHNELVQLVQAKRRT